MQRIVVLVGLWVAATAAAVGIAWGGVSLVSGRVVHPLPPEALAQAAGEATSGPSTVASSSSSADPSSSAAPAASGAQRTPHAGRTTPSAGGRASDRLITEPTAQGAPGDAGAGAPPDAVAPPKVPPPASDPPPSGDGGTGSGAAPADSGSAGGGAAGTTDSTDDHEDHGGEDSVDVADESTAPVVRSYQMVGGTVTLRFTPDAITVVAAVPRNDDFDLKVEGNGEREVTVEFESEGQRSRVRGWWSGGPQDGVEEEQHAGEDD